jgi:hypothetical protein
MTTRVPNVLWAQRPTLVYLTLDVQDVKGEAPGCHRAVAAGGSA